MKKLNNKKLTSLIIKHIPNHIVYEKLVGKTLPFDEDDMKEFANELLFIHDQAVNSSKMRTSEDSAPESYRIEGKTDTNYVSAIVPFMTNLIYIYDLINNRGIYGTYEIFRFLDFDGKQLTEMGSDWFQNILHPDDVAKLKKHHQSINHLHQNEFAEIEYRLCDAGGLWHWFRSRDLLLARDKTGEPTHILGTLKVITDQKVTKIELIESQALYSDLVSNQSAGIYRMLVLKQESGKSILETTKVEFVSDRFCELLEVDKTEFLKDAITATFKKLHTDDLQDFIKSNEMAQQSHEPYIWEGRLLIDNSIKWLRFESSPRKLEDGSTRWTGIVVDITKQKLAEEANRLNEERYRMLLELATDAFFQGDKNGNFITVNSVAIQQTGFSRDELLKMNMKDLFTDETLIDKPLKYEQLRKGNVVISERELICKDGKPITVEMKSRMMPDSTFQSFFRDITQRKLTEKALKRKLSELEIYYELAITRERKMIALKSEINLLLERLGEKLKY